MTMHLSSRIIPLVYFDHGHTPLDHYLLLIRDVEQARRRVRWQTYCQLRPSSEEAAALLSQLQHQFPTLHLDAVEDRVN